MSRRWRHSDCRPGSATSSRKRLGIVAESRLTRDWHRCGCAALSSPNFVSRLVRIWKGLLLLLLMMAVTARVVCSIPRLRFLQVTPIEFVHGGFFFLYLYKTVKCVRFISNSALSLLKIMFFFQDFKVKMACSATELLLPTPPFVKTHNNALQKTDSPTHPLIFCLFVCLFR